MNYDDQLKIEAEKKLKKEQENMKLAHPDYEIFSKAKDFSEHEKVREKLKAEKKAKKAEQVFSMFEKNGGVFGKLIADSLRKKNNKNKSKTSKKEVNKAFVIIFIIINFLIVGLGILFAFLEEECSSDNVVKPVFCDWIE